VRVVVVRVEQTLVVVEVLADMFRVLV